MSEAERAGGIGIDHDRLFRELLTTFFVEFLELFFPKLVEEMDRDSVEFVAQEHFASLFEGEEYRADLVVKARFRGWDAYFLVHVEHQSTAPAAFGRRMFRYFTVLFENYEIPVYPIVVYSHAAPRKKQPHEFRVRFSDGDVLRFRYRVVQLNRLPWRRFVKARNPVASALMARMKIAERDRPRVKLECLRLMVTLGLDKARMRLIGAFVDSYLRLSESEERRFRKSMEGTDMAVQERKEVMEYVTSWEERGIEKGRQQGLERGLEQGRQQGLERGIEKGQLDAMRAVLLDMLATRFDARGEDWTRRVMLIGSADELRAVIHRALLVDSVNELGLPVE